MPYPDDELNILMDSLLDVAVQALTDAGQNVPVRQFVSASQPPVEPTECAETLAVWAGPLRTAPQPGTGKRGCSAKTVAELHVTLYRCVPIMEESGDPPPVADLDASGRSLSVDGWVIFRRVLSDWSGGDLFENIGCERIDLSRGMINLPPLGGIAGWDLTVLITL